MTDEQREISSANGAGDVGCASQKRSINSSTRHAAADLKIEMNISVSIGASFFPADGSTAEELLGLADRRMYFHMRKYFEAGASPIDRPRKVAEVA